MTDEKSNLHYTIRRSHKAKRILLKVNEHSEVELVLPRWASQRAGKQFFRERLPWVHKILSTRSRTRARELVSGIDLVCFGQSYELVIRHTPGRSHSQTRSGQLIIKTAHMSEVKLVVERWYREQAKAFFDREITNLGLSAVTIRISGAKTRWGSCQANKRSLMFNWRLALAPVVVARYVMIHEVAHLQEHNHSKAFWNLVESLDGSFAEHRDWLKRHGHTLSIYKTQP